MRVTNFGSGPSMLPLAVLEEIRDELLDFRGSGISILEHSHRGAVFSTVFDDACSLVRELLSVPETHSILWMTGGGSAQFGLVPMNFLGGGSADYVDTGTWSTKAFEGARYYGTPRLAASGKEGDVYVRAPKTLDLDVNARYVHLTSNATLRGIQYRNFPDVGAVPLVADMSSDLLWAPVDTGKFSLIYAGAQKNLGIAGVTLVIVSKDFLARAERNLHPTLSYAFVEQNRSLHNTPPTFAIYVTQKMLQWIKAQGGAPAMKERNLAKATMLYGIIDRYAHFYRCPVERDSRSYMNAVFYLPSDELTEAFLAEAERAHMKNLRGHRTTGGVRAALYNAVSIEDVARLSELMERFAKANA